MLAIVWRDGLFCPVVRCDHCGREITHVADGNYEWEMGEDGEIVSGQIYFTHKKCCLPFERAHGGRLRWFWNPLSDLPAYLSANLGLDEKKAKRMAMLLKGWAWRVADD